MKTYVNVGICPVFKLPSMKLTLLDEMLYGMQVEILEETDDWVKIKSEYRYEGYCLKKNLIDSDLIHDAFVIGEYIDILSKLQYDSKIILSIPRGSKITILGERNNWFEIVLQDGSKGWTRKERVVKFVDYLINDKDEIRKQVIEMAKLYLGVQYRWGGKSPLGIDCSGLTSIVYLMNGITIYRDAHIKEEFGMKRITMDEIMPADLIYFPGHVALYLGNDEFIHSNGVMGGVVINSLNEDHIHYRKDLKESIIGIATVLEENK